MYVCVLVTFHMPVKVIFALITYQSLAYPQNEGVIATKIPTCSSEYANTL